MDEINVFVKMLCYSAYPGLLAIVTNYPICCHDSQAAAPTRRLSCMRFNALNVASANEP